MLKTLLFLGGSKVRKWSPTALRSATPKLAVAFSLRSSQCARRVMKSFVDLFVIRGAAGAGLRGGAGRRDPGLGLGQAGAAKALPPLPRPFRRFRKPRKPQSLRKPRGFVHLLHPVHRILWFRLRLPGGEAVLPEQKSKDRLLGQACPHCGEAYFCGRCDKEPGQTPSTFLPFFPPSGLETAGAQNDFTGPGALLVLKQETI